MAVHPIVRLDRKKTLTVCGLMSGTSADGIDACLVKIKDRSRGGVDTKVLHHHHVPYPKALRRILIDLAEERAGAEATAILMRADFALGEALGAAVIRAVEAAGMRMKDIDVVASHGQTIHHRTRAPKLAGLESRSTMQIGQPAVIAERTGAVVVSNFRARDIAAGGEGAPLVPRAEELLFGDRPRPLAFQNLGGIGNVTFFPGGKKRPLAFDTGPANMPLDLLTAELTGGKQAYDRDGRLAAKGRLSERLVEDLLDHPFFRLPPPKSAGREEFGRPFLERAKKLAKKRKVEGNDLLASLVEVVARSVADAYRAHLSPLPLEMIVSGGGGHNPELMRRIRAHLPGVSIVASDALGVAAQVKEALAFAVLGYETIRARPAGCPWATGSSHAVVLGQVTY